MTTTPTTQEQLDQAARAAHRARRGALAAATLLTRPGNEAQAQPLADEAAQAGATVLRLLLALGAARPGNAPVAADNLPLELLDTPASRRLLDALEEAQKAGDALDRERGWLQDGEPCGWGETLAGLALTLRVEIEGPSRQGGRE